ncbi:MAG: beta-galactosidase trimerization domain-containing protein [bacterium]|nr:beta-galactosidase trimerization domain-containing protein [bacterium]
MKKMLICSGFFLLIFTLPVFSIPFGWEKSKQGPIFLRVYLDKSSLFPIYLDGVAGWNYPRPSFYFKLGNQLNPKSMPSGTSQFIQPGGYSKWTEIASESLGNEWTNRIILSYPSNLPPVDSKITVEIASHPSEQGIVKKIPAIIGPRQPKIGLVIERNLEGEVAKTFLDNAEETHKKAKERCSEPVFGKRPEKFPCMTTLAIRKDEYPDVWQKELDTLKLLGINGIVFGFGPELKEQGFGCNGIQSFLNAPLMRWEYFPTEEEAEVFVKTIADRIEEKNSWDNVVVAFTFEEIGAPGLKYFIDGSKRYDAEFFRQRFIDYLKSQGLKPQDLGKKNWDEVKIVDRDSAFQEPYLFYHSARFRPWVITNVINTVDKYFPKYFKKPLYTATCTSDAYFLSGSMSRHGIDLLRWVRQAKNTKDMAICGWKNGAATYQFISWEAEVCRSAVKHKQDYGLGLACIVEWGRMGRDIQFAVYSSLAHGLNYVWYFSYGPWYTSGDYASHKDWIFSDWRKTNYAIGYLEDLLLETRPGKVDVAILYSTPTEIWDWAKYGSNTFWLADNAGIFLSLIHSQIPVEIICDEDVIEGQLKNYRVLYVTGTHITKEAAQKIKEWVRDGGVIIGTAGCCIKDQYNNQLPELEEVFGAKQSEPVFEKTSGATGELDKFPPIDNVVYGKSFFEPIGTKVKIEPLNKQVKIHGRFFSDDSPAIIENTYGKGKAYLFGFLPGASYVATGLKSKKKDLAFYKECYSPAGYSSIVREIINKPSADANAYKPVELEVPEIETGLRTGKNGAVLVLVNYPRKRIENLKIKVNDVPVDRITSIISTSIGQNLSFKKIGEKTIEIQLPFLENVDMIGINWRQ